MSKDSLLLGGVLILISLISALDIFSDLREGASIGHMSAEGIIFLASLSGIFVIARENFQVKEKNKKLHRNLEQSKQDTALWKSEAEKYLKGLGDAIDRQMTHWKFTPAEKEVGLLLLKGFSFKEIATFRETSERTARQQSLDIYKKSSMTGRAEFSAFFLEDLLSPKNNAE
ncbi:MAG: hypothetical protein COV66_06805 [Nitrospinae bacterium CG11_big_fil_rev_8_21_14_0_20_45_15]|nr:MAG: hypothetical protein COV66_06805 [Nitrospinae bacterium CG11_big_fil_rev_8_21_14_0_20_45_15]